MTRTTQALKRLGVASVVAATVAAGIPAIAAIGASAATAANIVLSPKSATSAQSTCTAYTATITTGAPTSASDTATVSVQIRQTVSSNGTSTPAAPVLTFCQPPGSAGQLPNPGTGVVNQSFNSSNNTAGSAGTASGNSCTATPGAQVTAAGGSSTTQCEAEFSTINGRSSITFGVQSDTLGTVGITAFQDTNGNRSPEIFEPNDTATDNIVSGAAQNLACSPKTQSAPINGSLSYVCTVTATGGFVVSGQTVNYVITSGPDSNTNTNQPCNTLSNANGQATCTITNRGNLGTDQILFYVEQNNQAGPQTGEPNDSATGTFAGAARNISCAPKSATYQSAGVSTVTCTVTDAKGNPVAPSSGSVNATPTGGQQTYVTFTSTGAGRFTDGRTIDTVAIGANGQATIQTTSQVNETGTQTVQADLTDSQGTTYSTSSTAAGNECRSQAGFTTNNNVFPAPSTPGNCTDTVTRTITASGSPSPSASSTVSPSPSSTSPAPSQSSTPAGVRKTLTLNIDTPVITAGEQATVTVNGAASQVIQLECYSRPASTYTPSHRTTIDAAGDPVVYKLALGGNTRCFAEYVTNSAQGASNNDVINVKAGISLFPVRKGFRNYVFQGHNLPKATGQLITLYYVTNNGSSVRKGNVKTDSSGIYYIPVKFVSNGTFTFYVRSGQTLNNAAGESNRVSVNVH